MSIVPCAERSLYRLDMLAISKTKCGLVNFVLPNHGILQPKWTSKIGVNMAVTIQTYSADHLVGHTLLECTNTRVIDPISQPHMIDNGRNRALPILHVTCH